MNEEKKEKNSLEDLGVIFLPGSINQAKAEQVCQQIIKLNVDGKHEHIQMIINSAGGELPSGFAIIDVMEWSAIPIYTVGLGMVASMALLIFMAGVKGHRTLTPNTSLLSHRFWSLDIGNYSDLLALRKQHDIEHQRILQHYIRYTNMKSVEELEAKVLRDVDTWLTPEEAIQHGLADRIEPVRKRGAA